LDELSFVIMKRASILITLLAVTASTYSQVASVISRADSILLYKIIPEDSVLSKYSIYIKGTRGDCFYCYDYSIRLLDNNIDGSTLTESCKKYLELCSLHDEYSIPIPDDNFSEPKNLSRKYGRRSFTFPIAIRGLHLIKRKREGPAHNSLRLTSISGPFSIGKSDFYVAIFRYYCCSAGISVIYRIEDNSEIYNYRVSRFMICG